MEKVDGWKEGVEEAGGQDEEVNRVVGGGGLL